MLKVQVRYPKLCFQFSSNYSIICYGNYPSYIIFYVLLVNTYLKWCYCMVMVSVLDIIIVRSTCWSKTKSVIETENPNVAIIGFKKFKYSMKNTSQNFYM